MNFIAEQFTNQLNNLFAKSGKKGSAPVLTTPTQLLMPANAWDWDVAPNGSILLQQFQFADFMPQSTESGVLYAASGNSFTDNYRTFLEVIPASFTPQSILNTAKAMITMPTGNPANDPTPPGWTKVTDGGGIIRWEPIYSLSNSASQWKQEVETGTINNPGTIVINLKQDPNNPVLSDTPDGSNTSESPDASVFEKVSITAASWGQITISPGSWFNSSIITLAKLNNYVTEDVISGLLSARVSAFYVAYKPQFKFSSSSPVDETAISKISTTPELYAFGIKVQADQPSADNTSVNLTSASLDPSIVAVVIETFS